MDNRAASDPILARASERIAQTLGLHFPPERWADLRRGLSRAAPDLGLRDEDACSAWVASAPLDKAQQQILAHHLTVGETYFFREKGVFETLANHILPAIIQARRNTNQRLRVWSAGCCTGEEPYSLAILLSQVVPDFADWHITILATDLNARFLQKAAGGLYSEWSFRDAPTGFKERYFQRTADNRYTLLPNIRRRVTFAQLNLVEDAFPSLATDTNAMDLIFCRNVLMYFSLPQMRKVIARLRASLVDGGWLVVSPSEVSQALFPGFQTENFPGAILYRKTDAKPGGDKVSKPVWSFTPPPAMPASAPWIPPAPVPAPTVEKPLPKPVPAAVVAAPLYAEGNYAGAAEVLLAKGPATPEEFSLLARALANLGNLREALSWCDRWLATDKLQALAHYLRAVVLQELGEDAAAGQALQRALYLEPKLILAHFALGNLARAGGRLAEADRHFANALQLLHAQPPAEALPESDGLTAGRLTEIITSLRTLEPAA